MNTTPEEEKAINSFAYKSAIDQAMGKVEEPEIKVMSAMKGWINHMMQLKIDYELDQEMEEIIINMAWIAAKLRTQVDRNMRGDIASPPVPELPPRLIKQMVSTAVALSTVFQINRPNEDVYKVLAKITRDTIDPKSNRYRICEFLLENPNQSRDTIVEVLGISRTTVTRELDDLRVLNFIQESRVSTGNRPGAKIRAFVLDNSIRDGMTCLR
jgi:Trp operon repressor